MTYLRAPRFGGQGIKLSLAKDQALHEVADIDYQQLQHTNQQTKPLQHDDAVAFVYRICRLAQMIAAEELPKANKEPDKADGERKGS